jgi:hypothetical protein
MTLTDSVAAQQPAETNSTTLRASDGMIKDPSSLTPSTAICRIDRILADYPYSTTPAHLRRALDLRKLNINSAQAVDT